MDRVSVPCSILTIYLANQSPEKPANTPSLHVLTGPPERAGRLVLRVRFSTDTTHIHPRSRALSSMIPLINESAQASKVHARMYVLLTLFPCPARD